MIDGWLFLLGLISFLFFFILTRLIDSITWSRRLDRYLEETARLQFEWEAADRARQLRKLEGPVRCIHGRLINTERCEDCQSE